VRPSLLTVAASYAAFEVRRTLRDPQVLVFLGFPVVLYPSLIWGMSELTQLEQGRSEQTMYTVHSTDPSLAEVLDADERLTYLPEGSLEALETGALDVLVQRNGRRVAMRHLEDQPRSEQAAEHVRDVVRRHRREVVSDELTDAGHDPEVLDGYPLEEEFLDDRSELVSWVVGLLIGAIGPLAMLLSGVYPAIDLFVVERERDTLETLLVSSVPRPAVVLGKLVACAGLMLLASVLNMGALAVSALHVTSLVLERSAIASWPPWSTWPMVAAVLASAALLSATALMASLVPARTYKEGEWITTTVLFGSFPLMGAAVLGVMAGETAAWLWAVPFAHTILAIAAAPTGDLLLWQAALTVATDVLLTGALLALLWATPGPQGLIQGAWRPPWLDRLLGSS